MTRKKFLLPLNLCSLRDLDGFVPVFHAEIVARPPVWTESELWEGFGVQQPQLALGIFPRLGSGDCAFASMGKQFVLRRGNPRMPA
ncbi:hypothetical protein D4R75_02230 [bacterium]|nr:MAG: hypothetical protein D4R75_02230 [bacterium]